MLRTATIDDAPRTLEFRKRILAEGLETIFAAKVPTLVQQEAWHRKYDDDDHSLLLLAVEGDAVVGVLSFDSFASTAQCRHAGSMAIAVLKSHRGKGVGSDLLETFIDWARKHPEVRRLELEVLGNNPKAKALYERFGFVVEGVKRDAVMVGDGFVDSIVMTKWV